TFAAVHESLLGTSRTFRDVRSMSDTTDRADIELISAIGFLALGGERLPHVRPREPGALAVAMPALAAAAVLTAPPTPPIGPPSRAAACEHPRGPHRAPRPTIAPSRPR